MNFFSLIMTVALAGFISWLIIQIPMPPAFKNVIMGLLILFMVLSVLHAFGIQVPSFR